MRTKFHLWRNVEAVLKAYEFMDEKGIIDDGPLKAALFGGEWKSWRNFGPKSLQVLLVRLGIDSLPDGLANLPSRCQRFLANANYFNPDGTVDMDRLRKTLIENPNDILRYRNVGKQGLSDLYRFASVPDPIMMKPNICPCCSQPINHERHED